MEKHRCKLCFRKFANGRALGGHMRCHMMNLPIPPKPKPPPTAADNNSHPSCEAPSSSTSSDSDHHDEEIPDDCFHPRLADHDSSSLISTLQDRESENESFKKKNNTTAAAAATTTTKRRRSKRIVTHKPSSYSSTYYSDYLHEKQHYKKCRVVGADDDDDKKKMNDDNNVNDMVEPVSCTSEVTSDEDLAFCLMMMSRDNWSSKFTKHDDVDGDADHDGDDDDDGDNMVIDDSSTRSKKKYKCETCDKVFRSYQALGGHRASHKKLRVCENEVHQSCNFGSKEDDKLMEDESMLLQKKVHECPVCFRVFSSGQALGGHKRSHVLATGNNINGVNKSSPANKNKMMMMVISSSSCHNSDSFIDLNLPAPVEDEEEISDDQIAVSAVSDVHF